jgi:hypothetical protein
VYQTTSESKWNIHSAIKMARWRNYRYKGEVCQIEYSFQKNDIWHRGASGMGSNQEEHSKQRKENAWNIALNWTLKAVDGHNQKVDDHRIGSCSNE